MKSKVFIFSVIMLFQSLAFAGAPIDKVDLGHHLSRYFGGHYSAKDYYETILNSNGSMADKIEYILQRSLGAKEPSAEVRSQKLKELSDALEFTSLGPARRNNLIGITLLSPLIGATVALILGQDPGQWALYTGAVVGTAAGTFILDRHMVLSELFDNLREGIARHCEIILLAQGR